MKKSLFGLFAGALLAAGCASPLVNGNRAGDPRLIVSKDIDGRVAIVDARLDGGDETSFPRFQATLRNLKGSDTEACYRILWFDKNGIKVDPVVKSPLHVKLAPRELREISATAPRGDVTDFRLEVTKPNL